MLFSYFFVMQIVSQKVSLIHHSESLQHNSTNSCGLGFLDILEAEIAC